MTDDISYLFRFRDLVAETIKAHKSVLKERNACWWGWWKRPTEGARMEIWQDLKEQASSEKPVRIGLFDSGNGLVYAAWVTDVLIPKSDKSGNTETSLVSLPDNQLDLVPEYYRSSPFSRAWMRFVKIEEETVEFFGKYSFSDSPHLEYYRKETLDRLKDKVIKSADELRGMDTTIWTVRLRQQRDIDEEIVLTTKALATPISCKPVDVSFNTILHISDPHFAVGPNRSQHVWRLETEVQDGRNTLAEAIYNALREKEGIGLVVVTGDLTFTGSAEEFNEASLSLQRLRGLFDLAQDHLVIIPGNHDIQWWSENKTYSEDAEVIRAEEAAKKNYKDFYTSLFRHEASVSLAMGRRFILPCGIALELCAVNSSALQTGKNFLAGMGFVEKGAFQKVANELKWNNSDSLALRMLAIHHHLEMTEDLERFSDYSRGFGIASDALGVRRMATDYGVHLALHGHKHRPFIWCSPIYESFENAGSQYKLGNLSILGGGSAGSEDTEADQNYFNLLKISSIGIEVLLYKSKKQEGRFKEIKKVLARVSLEGNPPKLTLGDWDFPSNS